MTAPAPQILPNWPGLMGRRLACDYLQLSPRSFALLTRMHGVAPVDCAGLNVRLWRKADLDRLIDNLPARGAQLAPEGCAANDGPPAPQVDDLAAQALARAAQRAKRP
ncbi:hypothetical protein [Phenylobacterium sp.]|uniref:hypothetical protein n=1 Tax=Phenylobacterium sp. TaxID=1871053 RepID=UPI002730ADCE|nr:hypothetical protein [Phenylobacterium sp.]MDP1873615.1 hypothetical protein [Phenylobacterium sp.]